jgi:hypothetical protein
MTGASGQPAIPAPGKACGSCSLCCKLMRIGELDKPNGKWCSHCQPGKGCLIYESRPEECQTFNCAWLTASELGDIWYPLNSKMVVGVKGPWITVQVEPAHPTRWRDEPYYSQFKDWSKAGVDKGVRVLVFVKNRLTIILPNKDLDMGEFNDNDHITIGEVPTSGGSGRRDWYAQIHKANDIGPGA